MRRIALLAVLPLLLVPAAAAAKGGPGEEGGGGDEVSLTMGGPPPDIRAGDTWNALMFASRGEAPLRYQNIAVTISNDRTGRAQTYYSEETAPGRYKARVRFPTDGSWNVNAQGGGLVADPSIADVAPAPSDPSPWPWVIALAALAALTATIAALARRLRRRGGPAGAAAPAME